MTTRKTAAGLLRRDAFTILEVVMVLAIVVIAAGMAMPAMSSMMVGEQLRAPGRELEAMAITARYDALAQQRPYQIIIGSSGFRLERPKHANGSGQIEELEKYQVASGVAIQLAIWPSEKWVAPKDHVWYFPPTGLCEPIRVVFRKDDSWLSQKYGAVTGWNQEEKSFIR